jgi:hypothetical protein
MSLEGRHQSPFHGGQREVVSGWHRFQVSGEGEGMLQPDRHRVPTATAPACRCPQADAGGHRAVRNSERGQAS